VAVAPARAEVDPESPPAPVDRWGQMFENVESGIDGTHSAVSRGIVGVVHGFDRFFGEDLVDTRDDDTLIRLKLNVEIAENDQVSVNNNASFRIALPQLSRKVQLIFDDVVERNEEKDFVEEVQDSQPLTGVRYVTDIEKVRYNTDVGLRLKSRPDFFVRGRASRLFPKDPWSTKLTQDVYWFREDGFGERSEFRLSRRLNARMLARATSRATWEENHDGVTFAQIFSLYDKLSTRRALRWSVLAEAPTHPVFDVDMYKVAVNWRQLIHSTWLYLEITPAVEFPRERDYKASPLIMFELEMLLGDADKPWTD
jgi:hypothetical protein